MIDFWKFYHLVAERFNWDMLSWSPKARCDYIFISKSSTTSPLISKLCYGKKRLTYLRSKLLFILLVQKKHWSRGSSWIIEQQRGHECQIKFFQTSRLKLGIRNFVMIVNILQKQGLFNKVIKHFLVAEGMSWPWNRNRNDSEVVQKTRWAGLCKNLTKLKHFAQFRTHFL